MKIDPYELTVDEWKELIEFNFVTGKAYWKVRDIKWFENGKKNTAERSMKQFNTYYAGKEIKNKAGKYILVRIFHSNLIKLHRLIWFVYTGKWPELDIDHINGVRDDNRIENLREVTHQENGKNIKLRSDNTSGAVGVNWHDQKSKWRARIYDLNGKEVHLGLFDNFEDAVAARKEAETKYGYHKNHGRN